MAVEGRRKREEGRGEEGRRSQREEGRGKREAGSKNILNGLLLSAPSAMVAINNEVRSEFVPR
ncbi:MAG: hypothetical protein HC942_05235 [Microcoleus sp. SU_5_6]|nr:hypothetical protein [Microcoleus sp. SU_5_6]